MLAIDQVLEITTEATTVPEELVISAFGSQSARLAARLHQLRPEEWDRSTRCSEWNVRELVQHLVTVTERALPLLDRELGPVRLTFSEMDPTVTPDAWVRADGRTSSDALLARYRAVTAEALQRAAQLAADGSRFSVHGPIGRVPWQLFLMHGLWDSWLHERDAFIGTALHEEPDDEQAWLVGSYCFFIAGEAARMAGRRLDETFQLGGIGGGTWRIRVGDHTSVQLLGACTASDPAGLAIEVFEALCGRGPRLEQVLKGERVAVVALAALANFFNPLR